MRKAGETTGRSAEAILFGYYLVGMQPNQHSILLYEQAMRSNATELDGRTQRLLEFAVRRPWATGLIDAGLAVADSKSELRRRMYVMFCILEASPEYTELFLPQKRNLPYGLYIIWTGIKGALRSAAGLVLVKVLR